VHLSIVVAYDYQATRWLYRQTGLEEEIPERWRTDDQHDVVTRKLLAHSCS